MAKKPDDNQTDEYDWLFTEKSDANSDQTRVLPPLESSPPRRNQPPAAIAAAPKPLRKPRLRLRLKLIGICWLIFLIAVPIWAISQIKKETVFPSGDRPSTQPGTNYLIVGSDSRAQLSPAERKRLGTGGSVGQRTDTIMILHTGSGPNVLLSIPRDSLVPIPGYSTTKINAAYTYGGPELLIKTLEQNTGLRIDNYLEIGFGGFVNIVDAVGGIRICTKKTLIDPLAKLHLKKGCHQADGVTALGYARTRHTQSMGDIDRAKNQREVINKIAAKVKSPWTFLNPFRYFAINKAAAGAIKLSRNTSFFSLVNFGWAVSQINNSSNKTCSMPISDLAVHWDRERALKLIGLLKTDQTDSITKQLCTPSGLID